LPPLVRWTLGGLFAGKALETLRDGQRHDALVIAPGPARFGIWFVAWNGTPEEIRPTRVGRYLELLIGTALSCSEMGISVIGFLEIDAYVHDDADPALPGPAARDFGVEIEYSYLPGRYVGGSTDVVAPNVIMLNQRLFGGDDSQVLEYMGIEI
jgi:hypothetical protein